MHPIHLTLTTPTGKLGLCASRFWGNPALPGQEAYPMYVDADGETYPYVFICQVNLEELAPYDPLHRLPQRGLLSFFAKIDAYLGCCGGAIPLLGGFISDTCEVKVLYFPDTDHMSEVMLLDEEDDSPISPFELQVGFGQPREPFADDHALFAPPAYRPWETWDAPYEDWEILLQVDSFEGADFTLNFMDCGVLDFLISPDDLRHHRFDRVRAIVLST